MKNIIKTWKMWKSNFIEFTLYNFKFIIKLEKNHLFYYEYINGTFLFLEKLKNMTFNNLEIQTYPKDYPRGILHLSECALYCCFSSNSIGILKLLTLQEEKFQLFFSEYFSYSLLAAR